MKRTSLPLQTARVHHAPRRRGGGVAARGAGAAGRADAAHRRAHSTRRGRPAITATHDGVRAGTTGIGLDRRPQHPHRHPLDCGRYRPHAQTRGGIARAGAGRYLGLWRHGRGGVARGEPHHADCVHADRRSGRRRLRRELGAARRQRHRIYRVRVRPRHEMAGATQRDRTARDARGHPSRCEHTPGDRPVRRNPGRCAIARGRAALDRLAQRR